MATVNTELIYLNIKQCGKEGTCLSKIARELGYGMFPTGKAILELIKCGRVYEIDIRVIKKQTRTENRYSEQFYRVT